MFAFEKVLPLEEFRGLKPKAWICVGAGFSREDLKAYLLENKISYVGETVQSFAQLTQRIAGIEARSVLASPARQELLRLLLSQPGLRERFPELKRLKRQGSFLRKLDHAVQAGRMAFAHPEEAQVYSERLEQKLGPNPVRDELEILTLGYEAWLSQEKLWDPPLVIREAIQKLRDGLKTRFPETIYYLCGRTQESLEKEFWEAFGHQVRIVVVGPQDQVEPETQETRSVPRFSWERWHTLDDAAERAVDGLHAQANAGAPLSDASVLITDVPSSRRTLRRALDHAGVKLSDPRDPTRIRWDEALKWALLPLEVAVRGFERARVIPYVERYARASASEKAAWVREIQERGIRNGLESYGGGRLSLLHAQLKELATQLGGKKTAAELGMAHLAYLAKNQAPDHDQLWVRDFYEKIWSLLIEDLTRIGLGARRAAGIYWLERLQMRVSEAPAPVERVKPVGGLDLYRMHQAPSRRYRRIYVFGIPSIWLSGEGVGDYWFSEREREILAAEFAVRSGVQIREERTQALQAWFSGAEEIHFLDAHYDPDGREREGISALLEEMGGWNCEIPLEIPKEPRECGSHPRWRMSYSALRPVPALATELPPLEPQAGESQPVISASALENYSRCGFLALARQRWRVDDLQEPDTDLWPHVKGIVLHEAVRLLVRARDHEGGFSLSPEDAVESAWQAKRPKGLLRGARIEAYVKRKLVALLRVFQEQERKYVQRAGTRVAALEDVELRMEYPGFTVVGDPDRIDEHPDGIWIIDYKTSSSAPNGTTMLENGYRLQLPFYAIAAQKKFGKPVLGFQFVQLDRKGTRTNGVYFKSHNGKEPGKITQTTNASKSLLSLPREEVWSRFEDEIRTLGARYVSGKFEAKPRISPRAKECESCVVSDLCGYRRLLEEPSEEGAGA